MPYKYVSLVQIVLFLLEAVRQTSVPMQNHAQSTFRPRQRFYWKYKRAVTKNYVVMFAMLVVLRKISQCFYLGCYWSSSAAPRWLLPSEKLWHLYKYISILAFLYVKFNLLLNLQISDSGMQVMLLSRSCWSYYTYFLLNVVSCKYVWRHLTASYHRWSWKHLHTLVEAFFFMTEEMI